MKDKKKSWLYYILAILFVLFGGTSAVGTITETETSNPQEATIVVEEQIQAESQVVQEEEYVSEITYYFRNEKLLNEHYEKHGKEMGFDSAELVLRTTNKEVKLAVDGKNLKADEDGAYHVKVDLTKQSECKIKVKSGDEEKEYTRKLADGVLGTVCGFEKEEMTDYVLVSNKGSQTMMNQDAKYVLDGEASLAMSLNKQAEDVIPYFAIEKNSKLIGGSWKDISSMKFYVYNASSEDVSMEATYYTSAELLIDTYQLSAGEWTLIEIQMPNNLDDIDSIQEFDFNFEKGSAVQVYMDNFATITKGEK